MRLIDTTIRPRWTGLDPTPSGVQSDTQHPQAVIWAQSGPRANLRARTELHWIWDDAKLAWAQDVGATMMHEHDTREGTAHPPQHFHTIKRRTISFVFSLLAWRAVFVCPRDPKYPSFTRKVSMRGPACLGFCISATCSRGEGQWGMHTGILGWRDTFRETRRDHTIRERSTLSPSQSKGSQKDIADLLNQ